MPASLGTRSTRYVVADYKTNRLGALGEPSTAWDYRPEAMAAAMLHSHYPLQAMLYGVVLHRYLRWRQPGYRPATHLGGDHENAPHVIRSTTGVSGPHMPRRKR